MLIFFCNYRDIIGNHFWEVHRRCHREKWRRIFKQIQRIKLIVGENQGEYLANLYHKENLDNLSHLIK
jgi:hypothetical protein